MKSLVLDLRGNPGGLLPQAIEVVSQFVPIAVRRSFRSKVVRSIPNHANSPARAAKSDDFPLVVMINGGSASASEIVAGAIAGLRTRRHRRHGQFRQRSRSESFSASIRHGFDLDDGAILHALRSLAPA